MPDIISQGQTEKTESVSIQWQCPICETINTENVCSVCGNPRNTVEKKKPEPNKKKSFWLTIVIGVIALTEAIFLALYAPVIANEKLYQGVCTALETENYEVASNYILELKEVDAPQYYGAVYRFTESIIRDGSEEEIVGYFTALNDVSKKDASVFASIYEKELYKSAVHEYKNGDYQFSKAVFKAISKYERSEDYLLLIEVHEYIDDNRLWWNYSGSNTTVKNRVEELIQIANFEDAGDLLMTTNDSAVLFLLGTWSDEAGTWITIFTKGDGSDTEVWANWGIEGVANSSWSFNNGYFSIEDNGGNDRTAALFEVIDENIITITVTSTKKEYTLNRK